MADRLEAITAQLDAQAANGKPPIRVVDVAELLGMNLPPRENLLSPWLPRQGLAMVYAPRGVGKTHVSLGIAYEAASGGHFLRWKAPHAAGVLLLDGEMPAPALQERLAAIALSSTKEPMAPLRIVTPDLQQYGMPDLSSQAGQEAIEEHIDQSIDLIIVDNLSTLIRSGKENEAESWQPIQTWALNLRARGKSVLFIHHAGKGGNQRGTSRREDVLDTVISLRRPTDYNPEDGAVFEVHYEKARGIHGDDVKPFEARLTLGPNGDQVWITRDLEDRTFDRVVELFEEGLKQADIARELEVNRSTVSRHVRKAKESGLLRREP